MPWWAVAILNWVAMVKAMRGFTGGKQTPGKKAVLELTLEKGNPALIPKLYDGFVEYTKYLERGGEQEKQR